MPFGDPRISWTVGSSGHGRALADVQVHARQSRPHHDDFIKAQSTTFPVQALCRILDVAPSGYYAWLKQPLSTARKKTRACFD